MAQDIKNILFTTDLAPRSKEVFEKAVALALQTGASITILHVIEGGSGPTQSILAELVGKDAYENIRQENESFARNVLIGKQKEVPIIREALKRLSQSAFSKFEDKDDPVIIEGIEVRVGNVVEEIIQIAEDNRCDLVVMGHHQKSMLLKAMMGSVVNSVLRTIKKPVYLVPVDE